MKAPEISRELRKWHEYDTLHHPVAILLLVERKGEAARLRFQAHGKDRHIAAAIHALLWDNVTLRHLVRDALAVIDQDTRYPDEKPRKQQEQ